MKTRLFSHNITLIKAVVMSVNIYSAVVILEAVSDDAIHGWSRFGRFYCCSNLLYAARKLESLFRIKISYLLIHNVNFSYMRIE